MVFKQGVLYQENKVRLLFKAHKVVINQAIKYILTQNCQTVPPVINQTEAEEQKKSSLKYIAVFSFSVMQEVH